MEEVVSTPVKEVPQTSVFKEVTINDIPEVTILERQASEGGDEGILEGPLISEEYEEGLDAPNEEDSDDEDDHGITIHAGKLINLSRRTPMRGMHRTPQTTSKENQQAAPQLSVNEEEMKKLRFTRHLTAFDVDINALDDQPWRNRTTDVSDYFNYGFNERTWMDYCEKQLRLRAEKGMGPQSIRDQMPNASVPKNIPSQIPAPSAPSATEQPDPNQKQIQQPPQPNMLPPGAAMMLPPGQPFGMMNPPMPGFQQVPGMPPMPPMPPSGFPPMPNNPNMPPMPPTGMPMPPQFFPGQMPPAGFPPVPPSKPNDIDQGRKSDRDQDRRGGDNRDRERDRDREQKERTDRDKERSDRDKDRDRGKRGSDNRVDDDKANKRSRFDDRERNDRDRDSHRRDESRDRKRGRDEDKSGRRRSRSSSPKSRRRDDSRDRKRR